MDRDDCSAKFWLQPVTLAHNLGFKPKNWGWSSGWSASGSNNFWRRGMAILASNAGERVGGVRVTDDTLEVDLLDGRTIIVPLAWYPRLYHATPAQRANWQIAGA
ncbi:MAG TPA: DUF2442 domain-containing protein, partial [Longimicrobium sp.]|nr:DUF2442 domain-containing protein [Longimicrobium sp.]